MINCKSKVWPKIKKKISLMSVVEYIYLHLFYYIIFSISDQVEKRTNGLNRTIRTDPFVRLVNGRVVCCVALTVPITRARPLEMYRVCSGDYPI